jgi:hypothetical protein
LSNHTHKPHLHSQTGALSLLSLDKEKECFATLVSDNISKFYMFLVEQEKEEVHYPF